MHFTVMQVHIAVRHSLHLLHNVWVRSSQNVFITQQLSMTADVPYTVGIRKYWCYLAIMTCMAHVCDYG